MSATPVPMTPDPYPKVAGYCPMGCGTTLFLGSGGYVTCSWTKCPNPTAVADILENPEHEHIVVFEEEGFSIKHPLRERANDDLFACVLHEHISALDGPPVAPGTYRATSVGGCWHWKRLP